MTEVMFLSDVSFLFATAQTICHMPRLRTGVLRSNPFTAPSGLFLLISFVKAFPLPLHRASLLLLQHPENRPDVLTVSVIPVLNPEQRSAYLQNLT